MATTELMRMVLNQLDEVIKELETNSEDRTNESSR